MFAGNLVLNSQKELIDNEAKIRKEANQKKKEKKEAFLNAQKQLLKTSEYIQRLDSLCNEFMLNIKDTNNHLLTIDSADTDHENAVPMQMQSTTNHNHHNHHNHNHGKDNNTRVGCAAAMPMPMPTTMLQISPLISSLENMNSDYFQNARERTMANIHAQTNASLDTTQASNIDHQHHQHEHEHEHEQQQALTENIDVPLMSIYYDLPLFSDNIQSCVYSACIYLPAAANAGANANASTADIDHQLISVHFEDEFKQHHDGQQQQTQTQAHFHLVSSLKYRSYLSSREILIEKLLECMANANTHENENENNNGNVEGGNEFELQSVSTEASSLRKHTYYEEILPFCFYALIIIQYQSSFINITDDNNNTENEQEMYEIFSTFIQNTQQIISTHTLQCLQISNQNNPRLLISCINKFFELLSNTKPRNSDSKHNNNNNITGFGVSVLEMADINSNSMCSMEWNDFFQKFYVTYASSSGNSMMRSLSSDINDFLDFIWIFLFYSSFYTCLLSMSENLCQTLLENFNRLFSKLSFEESNANTNANSTDHKTDDANDADIRLNDDANDNDSKEQSQPKPITKLSFDEIMDNIQNTLSSILIFDHHQTLLHCDILSNKIKSEIILKLQSFTIQTISGFLSKLEAHLNLLSDQLSQFNASTNIDTRRRRTDTDFKEDPDDNTNNNDNNDMNKKQSLNTIVKDKEYLEIGICCETLQVFITKVINEYANDEEDNADSLSSIPTPTPISDSLLNILQSINSIKHRAFKYWSNKMSQILFQDLYLQLEQKLLFWGIYEKYYSKTIWRSITIGRRQKKTSDDSNNNNHNNNNPSLKITDEDEEDIDSTTTAAKPIHSDIDSDADSNTEIKPELKIQLPCQPSEYMHNICFQFIRILLMIMTQQSVPNSIVRILEKEFRLSTVKQLQQILDNFVNTKLEKFDTSTESFALQLYFDIAFAKAIFETDLILAHPAIVANTKGKTKNGTILLQGQERHSHSTGHESLLSDILAVIVDYYIDIVTMGYLENHLKREIAQSVNGCLLMYGIQQSQHSKMNSILYNKQFKKDDTNVYSGGSVFAAPMKSIPRIRTLPVATYDVIDPHRGRFGHGSSLQQSPLRRAALMSGFDYDSHAFGVDLPHESGDQKNISQKFDRLTGGALTRANSLIRGFGTMFQ